VPPIDGYEVNDTRRLGEVYVQPYLLFVDDMTADAAALDVSIVAALVDRKWLSVGAPRLLEEGRLQFDHQGDGLVTIEEQETAFVGDVGYSNPRYIAIAPVGAAAFERARSQAERRLEPGENLLTGDGFRPILELEQQFTSDDIRHGPGRSLVWETKTPVPASEGNMTPDEHTLHIEVVYSTESGRIGTVVTVLDSGLSDDFEWNLADWQRRPTLGFDPLTTEELTPTQKQLEEILVSLDAFLEKE
jgi:hypothetical protein